jgi:hypothetical protein
MVDAFQPTYEQIIYRALQTIDQNNITSIAMPILEPSGKLFQFQFVFAKFYSS